MSVNGNLIRGSIPVDTQCLMVARVSHQGKYSYYIPTRVISSSINAWASVNFYTIKTDDLANFNFYTTTPRNAGAAGQWKFPLYGISSIAPKQNPNYVLSTGKVAPSGSGVTNYPTYMGTLTNGTFGPVIDTDDVTLTTTSTVDPMKIWAGVWYSIKTKDGKTPLSLEGLTTSSEDPWAGYNDLTSTDTHDAVFTFLPLSTKVGVWHNSACSPQPWDIDTFIIFASWADNLTAQKQVGCDKKLDSASSWCLFTSNLAGDTTTNPTSTTICNSGVGYSYGTGTGTAAVCGSNTLGNCGPGTYCSLDAKAGVLACISNNAADDKKTSSRTVKIMIVVIGIIVLLCFVGAMAYLFMK